MKTEKTTRVSEQAAEKKWLDRLLDRLLPSTETGKHLCLLFVAMLALCVEFTLFYFARRGESVTCAVLMIILFLGFCWIYQQIDKREALAKIQAKAQTELKNCQSDKKYYEEMSNKKEKRVDELIAKLQRSRAENKALAEQIAAQGLETQRLQERVELLGQQNEALGQLVKLSTDLMDRVYHTATDVPTLAEINQRLSVLDQLKDELVKRNRSVEQENEMQERIINELRQHVEHQREQIIRQDHRIVQQRQELNILHKSNAALVARDRAQRAALEERELKPHLKNLSSKLDSLLATLEQKIEMFQPK